MPSTLRVALGRILGAGLGAGAAALAGAAGFAALAARRAEAAVPPLGRFVEVSGHNLHYVDVGAPSRAAAPTIVMIHGLGGNLRNFTHSLVPLLADEFRVVAIERPGSGYSTRPRGQAANVRAQARTLADAIAALGIDRALLVGHSLGGAIALACALDHPARIGGIALIAPLTHPERAEGPPFDRLAIGSPLLRHLIAWTLAIPMSIRTRDTVMKALFGPEDVARGFPVAGGGLLSARPKAFVSVATDLVASGGDIPGLVARYGEIKVPAGILYGTGDRILRSGKHGSAMTSLLPTLDYEEIEGAGHMIPLTQPERCAAFIRRIAARMEREAGTARAA